MKCEKQLSKTAQTLPNNIGEQFEEKASDETAHIQSQEIRMDFNYQEQIEEELEKFYARAKMSRKIDRYAGIIGIIIFIFWTLFSGTLWIIVGVVNEATLGWNLFIFFAGPVLGVAGIVLSSLCLVRSLKS